MPNMDIKQLEKELIGALDLMKVLILMVVALSGFA